MESQSWEDRWERRSQRPTWIQARHRWGRCQISLEVQRDSIRSLRTSKCHQVLWSRISLMMSCLCWKRGSSPNHQWVNCQCSSLSSGWLVQVFPSTQSCSPFNSRLPLSKQSSTSWNHSSNSRPRDSVWFYQNFYSLPVIALLSDSQLTSLEIWASFQSFPQIGLDFSRRDMRSNKTKWSTFET